ncbi:hypothetical protein M9H77_15248 [Catharanthus roseus]|uniref:Uncharacterized protein n=1 Tax=Catharanthus roseus TaxID=4058 RepID=A0ACC0AX02_CATRO|nr:hypothetical protein M9H77_15248 [Catharanthus roseus]
MAKVLLKTMDANFVGRPKTAAGKYTTYNYSDIAWSPYGPYWRQARKICLMELFSMKRVESYEYIRAGEIKSLMAELYKTAGKPIVLNDYLSAVGLNVISRMVLGKRYLDESENSIFSAEEFKKMVDEWLLLNGVITIGDNIPWLEFLDLQGYIKRMKALSKKFDRFLEHVLDEHIGSRKQSSNIEEHGSKDMVDDFIVGGTESSTVMVEWAISELLKKPQIFNNATEELDRVISKNRWVEEKDMSNLPYIEAIIKETLRIAPLLVPRTALQNCQVAGYDIPKGTRVLVSTWTIGRDPALWENPGEFCPKRFIGKAVDMKGQNFELLPFGSGRRMCPGANMGLKVIQATLVNLLHGYKWRLPGGLRPEDLEMEEIFGLSTPKKIPLEAIAEPRLSPDLYGSQ